MMIHPLVCIVIPLVTMATLTMATNKVHHVDTLALFPEKAAWCEAQDIRQIVGHEGCNPKTIDNKVCVGQCFSYRIPRTVPPTPNKEDLHYCDCCKPSVVTWQKITLDCYLEDMEMVDKMVEMVQECGCKNCHDDHASKPIEL
ncbi:neuroblastoma suppressor of tumorigenicity 1-like [Ptychodera flava]|uniref:neuroblastoma suppressor of tumorigenicity 1-like n=1 Tax=Ptychodera flava TaxID=63121 RepID=UPI00396A63A9